MTGRFFEMDYGPKNAGAALSSAIGYTAFIFNFFPVTIPTTDKRLTREKPS